MKLTLKNLLQCLAISCMVALVSCTKDETDQPNFTANAFSVDGKKYNTLQDAVNAAITAGDNAPVIKLTANTSGDGFTVNNGSVLFDFDSYTYQLNPGKAINANGGVLTLTGNGGTLKGVGTVIRGSHAGLDIEGNLSISGDMDMSSMNYCGFWGDYSGVYSGNIKLEDTYMLVEADKAELNIGTFHPLTSSLNVIKAKRVSIENVANGESTYPVRTNSPEWVSVKNGAEVHIHKYAGAEPASCATAELMVKACKECDYYDTYIDENNTKEAKCHIEMLKHIAAVAESETHWGNIEYWECGACGRCYADSHASTALDPMSIMIVPKTLQNLTLFEEEDIVAGAKNSKLETALEALEQTLETADKIYDIVQDDPSPEEKLLELFTNMDKKFDAILGKLNGIQSQLNQLTNLVLNTSGEVQPVPRLTALSDLRRGIDNYGPMLKRELERAKKSGKSIDKNVLVPILMNWNGSSNRHQATLDLTASYGTQELGLRKVDDIWRDVLRPLVMWEHEGYAPRRAAMLNDIEIMQMSAILASYYLSFVKDYGTTDPYLKKELMKVDQKNLRASLDNYHQVAKDAKAKMEERAQKYMILCGNGNAKDVTFKKALGEYDVFQTLSDNRDNVMFTYKNHTACNTAAMSNAVGINDAFDEELILKLMAKYQTANPLEALQKSGFIFDNKRYVLISLHKYDHCAENRQATCGNWKWESKFGKKDDFIMIRGALSRQVVKPGERIWGDQSLILSASIDNETGKITCFGNRDKFYEKLLSVVVAK